MPGPEQGGYDGSDFHFDDPEVSPERDTVELGEQPTVDEATHIAEVLGPAVTGDQSEEAQDRPAVVPSDFRPVGIGFGRRRPSPDDLGRLEERARDQLRRLLED